MDEILTYTPGQRVTFYQKVYDGYVPAVTRIILPNFTLAPGYPQHMIPVGNDLYYFQFILPSGAAGIGTYFVDIAYQDANTLLIVSSSRQLIVTSSFGNYNFIPGSTAV